MSKRPKPTAKVVPRKKNGYVMPDPIPLGEVLTDMSKRKWTLGPSIGKGGFGEIYSAAEHSEGRKPKDFPYVVKIEPHGNGPLFVEMHFYMRNAKFDDIEAFRTSKKLDAIGMPRYIASGSHECNGMKYRFLVLDRYGQDLWSIFLDNNKCFPEPAVFKIGVQILDVLEYIHSKGYVHADVKGANALLGRSKSTQNQVYLVDFGLASHYSTKEYKNDPKKAHNGTIEYTSRDAHNGVPTRRGDLEVLVYNLMHWLGGKLPWESCLTVPTSVQASKEKSMENVQDFIASCFGDKKCPDQLRDFLIYISKMNHDSAPDYKKLRSLLVSGLKASGGSLTGPLDFKSTAKSPKRKLPTKSPTPDKKRKAMPNGVRQSPRRAKPKKVEDEDENGLPVQEVALTAEMKRVKERMEEAKAKKGKGKKAAVDSPRVEAALDDVVDETPPEKLRRRVARLNYADN